MKTFLKDVSWLSDLKLRYNYGRTGSVEGIDNYDEICYYLKLGTTTFLV